MGAQARTGKIQALSIRLALAALAGLCLGATPRGGEIELHTDYHFVTDPVSTERISELDPQERNPHRTRWVLNRKIELKGVEAYEVGGGPAHGERRFGLRVRVLESATRGYIRAAGPWYSKVENFPCRAEESVVETYGTEEGARGSVDLAARIWDDLLSAERPNLLARLSRVNGKSRQLATLRGLTTYDTWLRGIESEWRRRVETQVRKDEWSRYEAAAKKSGQCLQTAAAPPAWESLMEAPGSVPPPKPLVRAPARRWDGMFSVRLNVGISGQTLTGQFLVDTGASANVLAPAFLDAQGVDLSWVEQKEAGPQRVSWSGGTGLANRGVVDRTTMSGYDVGLEEFLLFDVDFFQPPENLASCCDGILGTDFLRKFVVEFRPGPPAEILIWPKAGFRAPGDAHWSEIHVLPSGELVSDCTARSERDLFGSRGVSPLVGMRWDTGSDFPFDVNTPWLPLLKTGGRSWNLECGSQIIAKQVPASAPAEERGESRAANAGLYSRKYPAASVGMPVLGRGSVIFDLPHGRIWFQKEPLARPVPKNTSGLVLDFISMKGERVLKVRKVLPNSRAAALVKAGVRAGLMLSALDDKPAVDLDLWEAEQRLSGVYGPTVTLHWTENKEAKSATLAVR